MKEESKPKKHPIKKRVLDLSAPQRSQSRPIKKRLNKKQSSLPGVVEDSNEEEEVPLAILQPPRKEEEVPEAPPSQEEERPDNNGESDEVVFLDRSERLEDNKDWKTTYAPPFKESLRREEKNPFAERLRQEALDVRNQAKRLVYENFREKVRKPTNEEALAKKKERLELGLKKYKHIRPYLLVNNGENSITINEADDHVYIGEKVERNTGEIQYFTRKFIKILRNELNLIPEMFDELKEYREGDAPFPITHALMRKDLYKGRRYYCLRHYIYYDKVRHPTRNGFNLTTEQMQVLVDNIRAIIAEDEVEQEAK